jgi:MazG family protein
MLCPFSPTGSAFPAEFVLVLPGMNNQNNDTTRSIGEIFTAFVEVVRRLRDPNGGCPWDLEQDHNSLRPYLLEEAYETLEAIEQKDDSELVKELGDLLLQVVLHAQVAKDRRAFDIGAVVSGISEKMIRRHPHVFGDKTVNSASEVLKNWEQIKQSEKPKEDQSALSGVPKAMPALLRAQRLGEKAANNHFDWENAAEVVEKIHEELNELQAELSQVELAVTSSKLSSDQSTRIKEELGDLLFALVQLSRKLGFSAEDALHGCSDRFAARFKTMESLIRQGEKPLAERTADELEALWQNAKRVT